MNQENEMRGARPRNMRQQGLAAKHISAEGER